MSLEYKVCPQSGCLYVGDEHIHRQSPYAWKTGDLMLGRMFTGGPMWAKSCPGCGSDRIEKRGTLMDPSIKCSSCGAQFGGASARR